MSGTVMRFIFLFLFISLSEWQEAEGETHISYSVFRKIRLSKV